jgi:5-formyltetrahydrofolate cyclo-ligase
MNNIAEQKKIIRKMIIEKKSHLTSDYISSSSEEITKILIGTDAFKAAKTIMCYLSFGAEVDTNMIIDQCQKVGKTILLPLIIKKDNGTSYMEASQLIDPKSDLAPGTMGILEPVSDSIRIRDPRTIDLIIVPGLAFDKNGNRLGYGAGYYDYFLERIREDCNQFALTFSFQLIEDIPTQKHDKQIKNIITEKGLNHIL